METEEIKQMISKKGAVVKESFISLFEIFATILLTAPKG